MKRFDAEVEAVWQVYNSAWSRNWGFVPMTKEEFLAQGKEMKQILVPDLVLIGEVGDRVVGFALALPDINQALKPAGGNLFPLRPAQNPVLSTFGQKSKSGGSRSGGGVSNGRSGSRFLCGAD